MQAILQSYKPNRACSAPERYLGYVVQVLSTDPRLGLATVLAYDCEKYRDVELTVDIECLNKIN